MNNYPIFPACNLLLNYQLYILPHLAILEYLISPTFVMINNKYLCDIYIGMCNVPTSNLPQKTLVFTRILNLPVCTRSVFLINDIFYILFSSNDFKTMQKIHYHVKTFYSTHILKRRSTVNLQ